MQGSAFGAGETQGTGTRSKGQQRTDERVQVLGVAAVQWARQHAGDDAARDLAEHVDPDLVPVAVEHDGRAQGAGWADGAARESSSCAEYETSLHMLPCFSVGSVGTLNNVPASSCSGRTASMLATSSLSCALT